MVGVRDVAKAAGVSLSTVSLVVNNTGYVSADMRAKVESAMRQLNYIPNELARNLYRNRTNTIGVIMPTIATRSSPHSPRICSASSPRATSKPYCVPPPMRTKARANTSICCSGT